MDASLRWESNNTWHPFASLAWESSRLRQTEASPAWESSRLRQTEASLAWESSHGWQTDASSAWESSHLRGAFPEGGWTPRQSYSRENEDAGKWGFAISTGVIASGRSVKNPFKKSSEALSSAVVGGILPPTTAELKAIGRKPRRFG